MGKYIKQPEFQVSKAIIKQYVEQIYSLFPVTIVVQLSSFGELTPRKHFPQGRWPHTLWKTAIDIQMLMGGTNSGKYIFIQTWHSILTSWRDLSYLTSRKTSFMLRQSLGQKSHTHDGQSPLWKAQFLTWQPTGEYTKRQMPSRADKQVRSIAASVAGCRKKACSGPPRDSMVPVRVDRQCV